MSPYPNIHQIEEIFALRCHSDRFNQYLADPIDITVVGQDFHAGGNYRSVQGFHENVYLRIAAPFKAETIRVEVRRVIGGGETSVSRFSWLVRVKFKQGGGARISLLISLFNSLCLAASWWRQAYTETHSGQQLIPSLLRSRNTVRKVANNTHSCLCWTVATL